MRAVGVFGVLVALTLYLLVNSSYRFQFFSFMADIPGQDRTGHFFIFCLLCATVNLGFAKLRVKGRPLGMRLLTLLVILVATLEEYSQSMIPWRTADLMDLLAGYAGIAMAVLLVAPFMSSDSEAAESPAD